MLAAIAQELDELGEIVQVWKHAPFKLWDTRYTVELYCMLYEGSAND